MQRLNRLEILRQISKAGYNVKILWRHVIISVTKQIYDNKWLLLMDQFYPGRSKSLLLQCLYTAMLKMFTEFVPSLGSCNFIGIRVTKEFNRRFYVQRIMTAVECLYS